MTNLMSAKDAQAMTTENKNRIDDADTLLTIEKLTQLIKTGASEGCYKLETEFILSSNVQKMLKSEGYKLFGDKGSYCEEAYWTISWE